MVKQRQRADRGSVQVNQRGNQIQLRWTVAGHRYSLACGINSPLNLHNARKMAAGIEQDIIMGQFDPTLRRYKQAPAPEPESAPSTIALFDQFTLSRRDAGTSGQSVSSRYKPMRSNLTRFGRDIESEADALKFVSYLRSRQSAPIANQNLTMLKSFGDWAVKRHGLTFNPFENIAPLKASKTINPKRKPFTAAEVQRLLETAKTHPTLYRWHDFCMTLLYLGLRPSEAIGIRWQDIDLQRGQITIAEALGRDENGRSGGSSRQRRDTKTKVVRTLDIPASLLVTLKGRAAATSAQPNALVFTTPHRCTIDDHNFSQRTWKDLCAAAAVPHHVPYASRHTLLSHGIESGMTLQQLAYIAGHVDARMVTTTYGHMVNRPKMIDWQELPNLEAGQ